MWPVHDTERGSLGKCSDGDLVDIKMFRRRPGRCSVGGGPAVARGDGAVVSALAASIRALGVLAAATVLVGAWVRRCVGA